VRIYHPWLKQNGKYSGPYYADEHGRWMCNANGNGEPVNSDGAIVGLYGFGFNGCDGSGEHDHTLAAHKLADGSEIGGWIDPGDQVR
jgi:hypothetical protein